MKEELTEKMHSEFTISKETEKLHTLWNVIGDYAVGGTIEEALRDIEGVTLQDVIDYLPKYNELFSENIILK